MFDRLTTNAHFVRISVHPLLDFIQYFFVLPAADPALFTRAALVFD